MIGNNLIFSRTLLLVAALTGQLLCADGQTFSTRPSDETQYRKANPQMVWGEITNFVRIEPWATNLPTGMRCALDVRTDGVIVLSGQPLKPVKPAYLLIENATGPLSRLVARDSHGARVAIVETNVVNIYLPPVHQRIALSLKDPEGTPVAQTREGTQLGAPLALGEDTPFYNSTREMRRKRLWRTGVPSRAFAHVTLSDKFDPSMTASEIGEMVQLDPTKYFIIKKPGLYKLTATFRFYVHGTNEFLMPITLPSIDVDVRVEE